MIVPIKNIMNPSEAEKKFVKGIKLLTKEAAVILY
jgi:hypothetical protein